MFLACLSSFHPSLSVRAHEAPARAGHKEGERTVDIETDFFAGRHGYLHTGVGVLVNLKDQQRVGLTYHTVREQSGESFFPSLGAEYTRKFADGLELELFSFGYFPVERQHAWAVGARAQKGFEVSEHLTLTPFFGPTWAKVRAYDEAADAARDIEHVMLFGGLTFSFQPVEVSIFGSQSFFSRDPRGLETRVDLEEMTHFASYENNDGFARNSVGTEINLTATSWFGVSARYAAVFFPDEPVLHSAGVVARFAIGERFSIFAGPQWLRGGARSNNLVAAGFSVSF